MSIKQVLSGLFKAAEPKPESVYRFRAISVGRRKRTCEIEIKNTQTLHEFDVTMRNAFDLDGFDHLSEFYRGERWPHGGLGPIDPLGGGSGSKKLVRDLKLKEGDQLGYVYDFGDEYHHILTLESVTAPEAGASYPHIIAKAKPAARKQRRGG
jgi:hypothetical protein